MSRPSKTALAVKAAKVAIPEAVVAQVALKGAETALRGVFKGRKDAGAVRASESGPVATVAVPFIVLRKARVRKIRGVTFVEEPRGLSAGEAALVAALVAAGYGTYEAAKWLAANVSAFQQAAQPPSFLGFKL